MEVKHFTHNPSYTFKEKDASTERVQLAYINIYFILYSYVMVGFILSALFIVVTEILIRWEERKVNKGINSCL